MLDTTTHTDSSWSQASLSGADTYAEVVLAPDASDLAHPAFSICLFRLSWILSVAPFFATGAARS